MASEPTLTKHLQLPSSAVDTSSLMQTLITSITFFTLTRPCHYHFKSYKEEAGFKSKSQTDITRPDAKLMMLTELRRLYQVEIQRKDIQSQ